MFRVILYQEVRELRSLYVYIYVFFFFFFFFFFAEPVHLNLYKKTIPSEIGRQWVQSPDVHTEPMNVSFCWSVKTGVSMYRSSWENIAYEFVLTSPAVPHVLSSY